MRLPFLIPRWLMVRLIPGFTIAEQQREAFQKQIERCRTDSNAEDQESDHATVFHYLLAQQGISDRSLVEEAYILIGAGTDTVANACTVGINAALTKPEIGKRIVEELREAWPVEDDGFGYARLEKLPYLNAFIKESLRCSFGVTSPLPRVIGPGDAKISGFDVPSEQQAACFFIIIQMASRIQQNSHPNGGYDPVLGTWSPDIWYHSRGERDYGEFLRREDVPELATN
ncbi:hypothetical protein V5O48_014917 [Marasmius crinis-equi]|uniref:Cytochrome P450 n=1 Tax=Marasmius crinis-equi TaxID=585013 RepID=A0ABR3EVZ0_9AGAR